jgi:hypothetical protein
MGASCPGGWLMTRTVLGAVDNSVLFGRETFSFSAMRRMLSRWPPKPASDELIGLPLLSMGAALSSEREQCVVDVATAFGRQVRRTDRGHKS